jgi:glyoxylase-like metal-dependent hydrolase (beta-lactamase superfamily II)
MTPFHDLDDAWRVGPAGARLEAIRTAAGKLRERLRAGKRATSVRTCDLITLPYPVRFGLGGAARVAPPYLMMTNRMQIVTFVEDGVPRRMLVNPSDHERDAATPFFARLKAGAPAFLDRLLARRHSTVPERLKEAGLRGDQIDYITYDHLHTQDLRRVMLDWCPKAKLLAMDAELAIFERIHPLQRDWYIAEALVGIPTTRIVPLDSDVAVGDGVSLVRTPGHTLGNHSIVLNTDRGLWTISENGVAVDNWAPERSDIAGVAKTAADTGVEIILNGNTREESLEQYTSMVLEKTLADEVPDGTGWRQHFSSSELTPSLMAPGLRASYVHKAITHGPPPA